MRRRVPQGPLIKSAKPFQKTSVQYRARRTLQVSSAKSTRDAQFATSVFAAEVAIHDARVGRARSPQAA